MNKKGLSTWAWILIVVLIVVGAIIVTQMILGAQTHPFWEIR